MGNTGSSDTGRSLTSVDLEYINSVFDEEERKEINDVMARGFLISGLNHRARRYLFHCFVDHKFNHSISLDKESKELARAIKVDYGIRWSVDQILEASEILLKCSYFCPYYLLTAIAKVKCRISSNDSLLHGDYNISFDRFIEECTELVKEGYFSKDGEVHQDAKKIHRHHLKQTAKEFLVLNIDEAIRICLKDKHNQRLKSVRQWAKDHLGMDSIEDCLFDDQNFLAWREGWSSATLEQSSPETLDWFISIRKKRANKRTPTVITEFGVLFLCMFRLSMVEAQIADVHNLDLWHLQKTDEYYAQIELLERDEAWRKKILSAIDGVLKALEKEDITEASNIYKGIDMHVPHKKILVAPVYEKLDNDEERVTDLFPYLPTLRHNEKESREDLADYQRGDYFLSAEIRSIQSQIKDLQLAKEQKRHIYFHTKLEEQLYPLMRSLDEEFIAEAKTESESDMAEEAKTESDSAMVEEAKTESDSDMVEEAKTESDSAMVEEAKTESESDMAEEAKTESDSAMVEEAKTESVAAIRPEVRPEVKEKDQRIEDLAWDSIERQGFPPHATDEEHYLPSDDEEDWMVPDGDDAEPDGDDAEPDGDDAEPDGDQLRQYQLRQYYGDLWDEYNISDLINMDPANGPLQFAQSQQFCKLVVDANLLKFEEQKDGWNSEQTVEAAHRMLKKRAIEDPPAVNYPLLKHADIVFGNYAPAIFLLYGYIDVLFMKEIEEEWSLPDSLSNLLDTRQMPRLKGHDLATMSGVYVHSDKRKFQDRKDGWLLGRNNAMERRADPKLMDQMAAVHGEAKMMGHAIRSGMVGVNHDAYRGKHKRSINHKHCSKKPFHNKYSLLYRSHPHSSVFDHEEEWKEEEKAYMEGTEHVRAGVYEDLDILMAFSYDMKNCKKVELLFDVMLFGALNSSSQEIKAAADSIKQGLFRWNIRRKDKSKKSTTLCYFIEKHIELLIGWLGSRCRGTGYEELVYHLAMQRGMDMEKFERYLQSLIEFKQKYERLPEWADTDPYHNTLYKYLCNQRCHRKARDDYPEECVKRLEEIGFDWNQKFRYIADDDEDDSKWMEKYNLSKEFIVEFGCMPHNDTKARKKVKDSNGKYDVDLLRWYSRNVRKAEANHRLPEDRIKLMLKLLENKQQNGMNSQDNDRWWDWYHQLVAHLKETNGVWPKKTGHPRLYRWHTGQRTERKVAKNYPQERVDAMNNLPHATDLPHVKYRW